MTSFSKVVVSSEMVAARLFESSASVSRLHQLIVEIVLPKRLCAQVQTGEFSRDSRWQKR